MAYSYLLATDYGNGYYEGRHLELSCSQRYDIASNTSVVSWNLSSVGGSNGIIPCGPTTVTINNQVVYTKGRTTTNEFPAIVHPGVTGTVFVHHDRYGKAKIECKVSTEVGRTAADV